MRNFNIILLAAVFFLGAWSLKAQTVVLKTDTVSIPCTSSDTFLLPVKALNFNNLGGIQFTLKWNTAHLQYIHTQDYNPQLLAGFSNMDTSAMNLGLGRMTFAWLDPSGLTIPNSGNNTLFNVAFVRLAGPYTSVSFDTTANPAPPTTVLVMNPSFEPLPFEIASGGVKPIDTEGPTIACPANQTVTASGAVPINNIAPTNITDNCAIAQTGWASSGATNAQFPSDPDAGGALFNPGVSNVTYTVTDAGGNQASCSFQVEVIQTGPANLTYYVQSGTADCGETFFVDVTTTNFDSIFGAQLSIAWQTAVLQFDSVTQLNSTLSLTEVNFNEAFVNGGGQPNLSHLAFGWNSDNFTAGHTLLNGDLLFRIYFTVTGASGGSSSLTFTDFPADTLSIDVGLNEVPAIYVNGVFTVEDETSPTLVCPANTTVDAAPGAVNATVTGLNATTTDNCSGNIALTYSPANVGANNGVGAADGLFPGGSTVVTYTAADGAGNTATCSFVVTVNLGEVFTLTIDDVNLGCSGDSTVQIPVRVTNFDDIAGMSFRINWDTTYLTYTGFSNPPAPNNLPVTNSDFPFANTTTPEGYLNFAKTSPSFVWPNLPDNAPVFFLNFNVHNLSGVTEITFSQPISAFNGATLQLVAVDTVHGSVFRFDNTPPVIDCPSNLIVPVGANCQQTVNIADATAIDVCGGVETEVTNITNNAPANNLYSVGSPTVVTFTATDNAGNTSQCTMSVTVNPNQIQVANCPSDTLVFMALTDCSALLDYDSIQGFNPCVANAQFNISYNFPPDSYQDAGVYNVTATIIQLGGGSGLETCDFVVEVVDGGEPVLDCPDNLTLETIDQNCYLINPVIPEPTATDNCDQTVDITIDPASIDTLFVGDNLLTFYGADQAGNVGSCFVTVTIQDVFGPNLVCPEDMLVEADPAQQDCSVAVNWTLDQPTDLCTDPNDININVTPGGPGDLFPVGINTVYYSATDGSNNTSTCSFTITVTEDGDPTLGPCPNTIIINLPEGQCDSLVTWQEPTATDACGLAFFGPDVDNGSLFPTGTTVVTYSAIDNAGNETTCSFSVILKDVVPPYFISFPNDVVVNDADPCGAMVNIPDPVADDLCEFDTIIYAGNLQGLFPIGTTTIEITAYDASGNFVKDTLVVTVISIESKGFDQFPSDQVIMTQNCDAPATWTTPTLKGFCEPENVTLTSDYQSGDIFPIGSTVVTYTATEPSGATFTGTFTITVEENQDPVINCPNSVLVSAAGVVVSDPGNMVESVSVVGADCRIVNLDLNLPVATDNCPDDLVVTQTGGPALTGEFPIGTYTFTFQATDGSGNSSSCSVILEVAEFAFPTPSIIPNPGCAGDTVLISSLNVPGATYTWTGPNGPYGNVSMLQINNLSAADTGVYQLTVSLNGCIAETEALTLYMPIPPDAINDLTYVVDPGQTLDSINVLANDIYYPAFDIEISQKSPLEGLTLNPDGSFTYVAGDTPLQASFLYEICSVTCPDLCDMAEVTITVRNTDCDFVPNIFTPNGDDTNDLLKIPCLDSGKYPDNTLVIYNQWGDKVFEAEGYSNDPDEAWNGRLFNESGKDLPDGVYYYIFQPAPNDAPVKGFVHIYR